MLNIMNRFEYIGFVKRERERERVKFIRLFFGFWEKTSLEKVK